MLPMLDLPTGKGSYLLVFHCEQPTTLTVGQLGDVNLPSGMVLYAGSAYGPGGLQARIARHWRLDKPLRWHIDYLRPALDPLGAWISEHVERKECIWANKLLEYRKAIPLEKVGSSDCGCKAHTFCISSTEVIPQLLGNDVQFYSYKTGQY